MGYNSSSQRYRPRPAFNAANNYGNNFPVQPRPAAQTTIQPSGVPAYQTVLNQPKPATNRRSSGGGGGGSAGGGGVASTQPAWKPQVISGGYTPGMENFNYNAIDAALKALGNEYASMRFNYKPQAFQHDEWAGRDPQLDNARARIRGEIDYANPHWAAAERAARQRFGMEAQALRGSRDEDLAMLDRAAYDENGRFASMAANMGLNAGAGALAENFGLASEQNMQRTNAIRDYANQIAQQRLGMSDELGRIGAERTGAMAGAEGRAQGLADELAMADFERYAADRSMKFGEHNWFEDSRRGSEGDRIAAILSQLQGREGLLGARAGLIQDQRNFMFDDWWTNKNFNYTQYSDDQERDYRGWSDRTAMGESDRRYADEQDRWREEMEMQKKIYERTYGQLYG